MASTRSSSGPSKGPTGTPVPGALALLRVEHDGTLHGSTEVGPLLGLPPGQTPRTVDDVLALAAPGDREALRAGLTAPVFDAAVRVTGPDGARRRLLVGVRELPDGTRLAVLRPDTSPDGGPDLFRRLADTAPVLIWAADAWGGFLFVNDAWTAFTGRPAEDALGDGWLESVHPEDRAAVQAARSAAIDGRQPFLEVRYRLAAADGTWRWLQDRGLPYAGPDGEIAGWVGAVTDIHERETELARAEVLAAVGEALEATLDEDRLLQGVVDVCAMRFGTWATVEFGSRVAASSGSRVFDHGGSTRVPIVAAGGRVLGSLAFGARAGDALLLQEIGRRTGLALQHVRLFAEAGRQQRASEEARALLDALVSGAPVGFAQFDASLRYVRVNEALAELNGVPAEDHVGKTVSELLPEMDPGVEADLRRVLETGEPLTDVAVVGATPAAPGRLRNYLASYYRVTLPDGETLGLGATVLDVTARLEAERALRAQRDLYEALLRAQSETGEAFLLLEGERLLYVNEATERIVARDADELYGLGSVFELVAPADRPVLEAYLTEVRAGGPLAGGVEVAVVTPAGARVDLEVAARAMSDGRTVVLARDVSERKRADAERERLLAAERRAREETEAARGRAAFLAEVSGAMERSLSMEETLGEVVRLLARDVCDMTSIWVTERDGFRVRRYAAASRDPERLPAATVLRDAVAPLHSPNPACVATRTGRRLASATVSGADLRDYAGSEQEHEALQRLSPRSLLTLPLMARGRTVGALILGWDVEAGWPTDEAAVEQLDELARRVALFIDNALLYAEQAHVASTLQASLLPPELPPVDGIEVAARYLPAGEAAEVGGDFYDVFPCGDGWAFVVGDVCGKGTEAAAVTAMARYTLRAAVTTPSDGDGLTPAGAFDVLNRAMLADAVPDRFLTAVMGCLTEVPGARTTRGLRLALAGHPAPVLVRPGEPPSALTVRGPLLGVRRTAVWQDREVELHPGDALVLYTDGVTEADRHAPLEADELAALLAGVEIDDAEDLADAVQRLAERRAGGPLRDDVAIVALRLKR